MSEIEILKFVLIKKSTLRSVNDVTEAHMLPRKVGKMVWIFGKVSFEENDVCFLCTTDGR